MDKSLIQLTDNIHKLLQDFINKEIVEKHTIVNDNYEHLLNLPLVKDLNEQLIKLQKELNQYKSEQKVPVKLEIVELVTSDNNQETNDIISEICVSNNNIQQLHVTSLEYSDEEDDDDVENNDEETDDNDNDDNDEDDDDDEEDDGDDNDEDDDDEDDDRDEDGENESELVEDELDEEDNDDNSNTIHKENESNSDECGCQSPCPLPHCYGELKTKAQQEVVDEEQDNESDYEEEVIEYTHNNTKYFITNEKNGIIYENLDDDIGDEVGKIVNGNFIIEK